MNVWTNVLKLCFSGLCAVLMLFTSSSQAYSQNATKISGTVKDASGEAIVGVAVVIKNTTNAAVTDVNGVFSLNAAPNDVLEFSHLGYNTTQINIKAGVKTYSVVMITADKQIDAVVVVGYGTQKKVTVTGAVSSVKNEEIIATKNENLQNMLTGKVAGLRVVQNSSEPGSFKSDIDIRGLGNPLVVIDGIPRGNMSRLDPDDIESISVLKDASASIYGVRAANGVILITTKKGKKGAAVVSYSGNFTWQIPSDFPDVVSAEEYMILSNEKSTRYLGRSFGPQEKYTNDRIEEYRSGAKQSVNWKDEVFRSYAPQTQHNMNVSGGTDKMSYYASFGYLNQGSFIKSNSINYDKYTLRSNVEADITDRLKWDIKMSGIMDTRQQPGYNSWYIVRATWLTHAMNPVYQDEERTKYRQGPFAENPVAMMDRDVTGYKSETNKFFQSSTSLSYDIPGVKGLKARAMYSYDYYIGEHKYYDKTWSMFTDAGEEKVMNNPSKVQKRFFRNDLALWQTELNYNNKFNDHNVTGLLLFEHQKSNGDNLSGLRELTIPIDHIFAGNDDKTQKAMQDASDGVLFSRANKALIGRAAYDYKSKYMIEFAFRYEGSSKFPTNSRWELFPSVSGGWRISEEKFWEQSSLNFIDNLKFRASYGKMGDDGALAYQFLSGYTYPSGVEDNGLPGGSVFDGSFVNGSKTKGTPNTAISWSISETTNVGVDLEAWNGLLGFTGEYFVRERSGLLAHRLAELPGIVGATLPQENINGDKTTGFEIELSHRNRINEFSYSVRANLSYTRTKNTHVERSRDRNSYDNWRNNGNNRYGDIWWGYGTEGQFENWDQIYYNNVAIDPETLPGCYRYEDWNGDGMINSLDLHPITTKGDRPLVNFGISVDMQWRSLDFNMLLQGSGKRHISYTELLYEPLWADVNALSQFMDRWHPEDPKASPYDPATKWTSGHYAYTGYLPDQNSGFNMQNAAYLRLKSVELGYTLPNRWTKIIGLNNLRFYVNGYNLFTFTKVKYLDPEFPASDYGYNYPLNKTITLGITAKF